MGILISFLVALHGLIHAMGFLKAFGYGMTLLLNGKRLVEFSPAAARVLGVCRFFCTITLLVASVLCLMRKEAYCEEIERR